METRSFRAPPDVEAILTASLEGQSATICRGLRLLGVIRDPELVGRLHQLATCTDAAAWAALVHAAGTPEGLELLRSL